MAIGFRAAGTVSGSLTNPTPGMPTYQVGDILILVVITKAEALSDIPPTCDTPTGWTTPPNSTITGGVAGSGGFGADAGVVRIALFTRLPTGAGESAPSLSIGSGGNPNVARIFAYSQDDATQTWDDVLCAVSADTTGSTTSYDPSAAADTIPLAAGDWLGLADAINGDQGIPSLPGSLTITGVTLNTLTQRANDGILTGDDARLVACDVSYSSGTASAGPDRSISYTSANANMGGCTVFYRLRTRSAQRPKGRSSRQLHPGHGPFVARSRFHGRQLSTKRPLVGFTVDQTDQAGLSDALAVVYDWLRTDEAGLSDTATPATGYDRSFTDNAGLSDTVTVAVTRAIDQTDPINPTDTVTAALISERTFTDDTGLTDTATAATSFAREFTDQTGLTDSFIAVITFDRTLTEQTGLTDAATAVVTFDRTFTDQTGLTDTATVAVTYERLALDDTQLTDAATATVSSAFDQSSTDSAGLTDAATAALTFTRQVTDQTGLTDSASVIVTFERAVTEQLGLTDTVAVELARVVELAESDSAGLGDEALIALTIDRMLADLTGLGDFATVTLGAPPATYATMEPVQRAVDVTVGADGAGPTAAGSGRSGPTAGGG